MLMPDADADADADALSAISSTILYLTGVPVRFIRAPGGRRPARLRHRQVASRRGTNRPACLSLEFQHIGYRNSVLGAHAPHQRHIYMWFAVRLAAHRSLHPRTRRGHGRPATATATATCYAGAMAFLCRGSTAPHCWQTFVFLVHMPPHWPQSCRPLRNALSR